MWSPVCCLELSNWCYKPRDSPCKGKNYPGTATVRENYPEEHSNHISNLKKMNKIFIIKKRNPKMLWGLGVLTVLKYQLPLEFIENDWKPWKWSPGCWQHTVESESHFCCDLKVGTGSFINVSLCNTICISIYFSAEWLLVGGLSPNGYSLIYDYG